MSEAPFHNRAQFERAVERLIAAADEQNRGADLDRVVAHLENTPEQMPGLAGLLLLIDDDARPELKAHIDAFRRFHVQKGGAIADDEVLAVLQAVYRRVRGA